MAWNPYGSYTQAAQGPDDSYGDLSYDAYREPETDSSSKAVLSHTLSQQGEQGD